MTMLNNWRIMGKNCVTVKHIKYERELSRVEYFNDKEAMHMLSEVWDTLYNIKVDENNFDEVFDILYSKMEEDNALKSANNSIPKKKKQKIYSLPTERTPLDAVCMLNTLWLDSPKFEEKVGIWNMTWFFEADLKWEYKLIDGKYVLVKRN